MTGYSIFLSSGTLLTTVNVKTIDDRDNSSLYLIGQGIPNYGTQIAQNFIWLLENFSKTTVPVNPLQGQEWHDRAKNRMNFYTGTEWLHYDTPRSSSDSLFDMAAAATNLDFTVAATTTIFTADSHSYYPTGLILVPNGTPTASTPPTFNVFVNSAGDVLASNSLTGSSATTFKRFSLEGGIAFVPSSGTLNLQVSVAATGGHLSFDVYMFGFSR